MSLIKQSLIDKSKYSIKCPYDMQPIGICIHNTYNDASASNEISYMKSNSNQVSYHIAIDDKEAIQGIPFNRNAWASGDGQGQGNRRHIHIEICYSKSGGSKFIAAEKLAAKVVAELLNKYNWGIDKVKAHRDFANKNCPHRTDMNTFKKLVSDEMNNVLTNTVKVRIDGKEYDIEGLVNNGTTYIKLRDFEKAKYKIGYVNGVATIDKP